MPGAKKDVGRVFQLWSDGVRNHQTETDPLRKLTQWYSHNKAECPNPKVDRPFKGTCRLCNEEGHRAGDCPQKPPSVCKNCLKEGKDYNQGMLLGLLDLLQGT